MDFKLNEEHEMIVRMVRDFAQKELLPIADKIDEEETWPTETVNKMGELGLMGMEIPSEYGGAGLDTISYVLAIEELSKVSPAHGIIASVNNSLFCHGIYKFGTEEQKKKFLIPCAKGEKIGAFSLTEPQAGSDASNLIVNAKKIGDRYIINGMKNWVTNGPKADYIITFVVTDKEKKHRGITAFVVDTSLPGITRGKPEKKLGIRAAQSCALSFENYEIPESYRLGEEGEGFKIAMSILDAGRIGVAAQALGIAEGALESAIKFAMERVAFGQPIIHHQFISFLIADMETKIESARYLTLKSAWLKQTGQTYIKEAAMAKLHSSETAMWVTTKCVQILGSLGYSREHPAQRFLRDAKITEIYEGTSEIQRIVISREIIKHWNKILAQT